jgi:hypothetical protein
MCVPHTSTKSCLNFLAWPSLLSSEEQNHPFCVIVLHRGLPIPRINDRVNNETLPVYPIDDVREDRNVLTIATPLLEARKSTQNPPTCADNIFSVIPRHQWTSHSTYRPPQPCANISTATCSRDVRRQPHSQAFNWSRTPSKSKPATPLPQSAWCSSMRPGAYASSFNLAWRSRTPRVGMML